MEIIFDVNNPGEYEAGILGYSDTVTVRVESGDPGGEPGEFAECMTQALIEWFDGANHSIRACV